MTASRGDGNAPGRIFISYRREETAYSAGWLFDRLSSHFGDGQVFKDVDSIELGDDFVEVLTDAVGSCDVLLALIGDQWLTVTDEDGRRRLDNSDDFVRLEIEAALTRNVRVIPILVSGAQMPRASDLPASMAGLVHRQALELSPSRFDSDLRRLLRALDRTFADMQPFPAPAGQRPPAVTQLGAPGPAREAEAIAGARESAGAMGSAGAVPAVASTPGASAARKQRRIPVKAWIFGGVGVGIVLTVVVVVAIVLASSHAPPPAHTGGTPTPSPTFAFREDFSGTANAWAVVGQNASGRYSNGTYQIYLKPADLSYAFAAPHVPELNPAPSNITVEVSARAVVGAAQLYYGIACRSDSYAASDYEFSISQGYAEIDKSLNGDFKVLAGGTTTAVNTNGENQLRAECTNVAGQNAVHLVFWVNGQKVQDVVDRKNTLTKGIVGLFVSRTSGKKNVDLVEFDNFTVRQI